jgi:prolyl oligopeptidase
LIVRPGVHAVEYPAAPVRPERNSIGGIEYDDPYQWLEGSTPEVLGWQAAQNALTDRLLTAQAALAGKFEQHLAACFVDTVACYAPREIGEQWWRQYRPEDQRYPVVEVAPSPSAPGRIVFDANALADMKEPVLGRWEPSPDGTKLLASVSAGGGLPRHLVLDLATGDILRDGLEGQGVGLVAWGPASDELYYTATELDASGSDQPRAVTRMFRQALEPGAPRRQESVDFPHPAVWPVLSSDRRFLIAMMDQTAARPAYIKDLASGEWREFLRDLPASCKGHIVGDEYIAVTTLDAPRGRVVAVPLRDPGQPADWRVILRETDAKIASVTPVGGELVVGDFLNGATRLRRIGIDGVFRGEIQLPGQGAVGKFALGHILSGIDDLVWTGPTGISFMYSSITSAPASYRWTPGAGLELIAAPRIVLNEVEETQQIATSRDGTRVPYRVYRSRDARQDAPVITTGYGGFNVPWLPAYDSMAAAWLMAGGMWVHTHLRGGGEFGTEWWQAGRMHRKQNTFDDMNAVAEALVASGLASHERLGVVGSSNGGLLAGAAIVQRPDLYGAAVPQVPILDLLRFKNDPVTYAIGLADYGNPDLPEHARHLRECSPYHGVVPGKDYPAVLLDAGEHDRACPPWHARKMAARLQAATRGAGPILLRVRAGTGHNAMSEDAASERIREELVFMGWQLRLQP